MGSKVIPVAGVTGYGNAFRAKMLVNQPVRRIGDLVIEEVPPHLAVGEEVPLCRNTVKSRERNREIASEGSTRTGVARAGFEPAGSQPEMRVPAAVVEVQLRDVAAELKSGKVLLGRRIANDRPRGRQCPNGTADVTNTRIIILGSSNNPAGPDAPSGLISALGFPELR